MKKILVAVDDTKSIKGVFGKCVDICKCLSPDEIAILFVEKFEGRSLVGEMMGTSEMATLKEVLEGTEYKEALDAKAQKILSYYKGEMEGSIGSPSVKTILKSGHPAEEILSTADEEGAEMIIIGSRGERAHGILMGSVSREVANSAKVPVLIMR